MGGVIAVVVILLVTGLLFLAAGFFIWRNILRFAKGVERGLKMVPMLIHLPPPSEDVDGGGRDIREVIQERISQAEVLYNLIAGTFKKGFKTKLYGQRHLAFEIVATGAGIKFFVAVPVILQPVIEQAVMTAYPTARLEEVEDPNVFNPQGRLSGTIGGEVTLKEHYAHPIATFTQLKREATQAMITAMTALETGDGAAVQILIRPAMAGWTKNASGVADGKRNKDDKKALFSMKELLSAPFKVPEVKKGEGGSKDLSALEQSVIESIEEKTRYPGFEVMIRVVASSHTAQRSQTILSNITAAFALFDAPGLNGFSFKPAKDMESFVTSFIFRFFPPENNKMILNSIELATLFHLPDDQFTHTSKLERQFSKQIEAPAKLAESGLLVGYNSYRSVKREIRLTDEDRRRHMYVVGQTGTGKSTILKQLIVQDMIEGRGVAFIDPHGDASEELLALVPPHRTEDVIYFSPGEMDYPLGLNLFEHQSAEQKDFLIQEAINMLYRLYDPQHQGIIGPIYEHWFRNAALAVMAPPEGGTFIDIPKLFLDKQFMRERLKYVKDPTVLDFWNKEMVQTSGARQAEILGWFVSKFGAFASNEMMRNIIGQVKSSFDLREVMDDKKILIANLSKGRLGELNSQLLGMIFVMKFQAAAMSRANIPEAQRPDFTLYVDEFQNFSTDSFATILAEARKYHLSLIVANQYIAQLDEQVREAIFGNVGTIISFRCGPNDAEFLVKQFAPAFDARDLVNLPNFQTAMRLMIGGLPSQPFSMAIGPPLIGENLPLALALKQLSAAKYGRPRSEVEEEIFKRLETKPAPNPFANIGGAGSPFGELGPPPLGQPALPPRPTLPAGQTGSSFLDEWLAKRRQTPPAPAAAAPVRAQTDHDQVQSPRRPETAPRLGHFGDQSTAAGRDWVGPAEGQPASSATTMSKSAGLYKHQAKPPAATPPKPVPPDLGKATNDQFAIDSQVARLEAKPPGRTVPPAPAQPPATAAKIPPLKPGEIYIDEEGDIHRADEPTSHPK
ncbi:type IV secretory system conjugative DNA transfer family protein [Candidatus Microgenomates bacterium]|nr:type IV secretory system conjugative DNA transfer family protein [Candidatus Microgenomates bacterium]